MKFTSKNRCTWFDNSRDKNAPIFNYADYGLVGDIYKVVPALISQLSR